MLRPFFCLLLALLAFAAPVLANEARLLVYKQLDHNRVVPYNFALGQPINVTLTVINVGDATAHDVAVEDQWSEAMFKVEGSDASQRWDEIAPGAQVSVSYFVTPNVEGGFESLPARVAYKPTADAPLQYGYSSSVTNLNVIPSEAFLKQTSSHTSEWLLFFALLGGFVVVPGLKWYEVASSFQRGARRTKAE